VTAGGSRELPSSVQLYGPGVNEPKAMGEYIALRRFREPPVLLFLGGTSDEANVARAAGDVPKRLPSRRWEEHAPTLRARPICHSFRFMLKVDLASEAALHHRQAAKAEVRGREYREETTFLLGRGNALSLLISHFSLLTSHSPTSPKSAKERAQIFGQKLRFFRGREMAAARHFGPMLHIISALDPGPRRER